MEVNWFTDQSLQLFQLTCLLFSIWKITTKFRKFCAKVKLSIVSLVVPVPPSLRVSCAQPLSLCVEWGDHPDGGSPVTEYRLSIRELMGLWTMQVVQPHNRSFIVRNLR